MNETISKVWMTCGYVRLSREDGDKEESNSVTGQKDLIRDYFSRNPELREYGMKVDDGYTGSNFERPGFQEMIADVKAGKINCIVVKDLSRFGRDHLGVGEYIERIFPFLGVRFIAINDHYDSLHHNQSSDGLIIPIKNLINEAYCRDTSIKIRSQLEIKRKRGDFIGSFATFGYQKNPDDRHKLVVDEYAAAIVRDIFQWKLDGISAGDIAVRLNHAGVPTPMDYKNAQGMRYSTAFRKKKDSTWSTGMVLRILKNPVYIGVLEQGRVTTPSYQVKKVITKPKEEWAVVENNHPAIIDRFDFETIQRVLALDTRTSSRGQAVDMFSGMVFCGECGAPMVRKTIPSRKKKYVYYVCSAHKNDKTCFGHTMRDGALTDIVLELLKQHIHDVIGLSTVLEMTSTALLQQANLQRLRVRLEKKQAEVERFQNILCSLYENLTDGIITRDEYHSMKKSYTCRRAEAEEQAEAIQEEINREMSGTTERREWIEQFRKRQNITALDRAVVVSLIERVLIYQEHRIEIVFRWQNEFQWLMDMLVKAQHSILPDQKAV